MNQLKIFNSCLGKEMCARSPTPPAVWIHQIHATGGVKGTHHHGNGVCNVVCAFVRSFLVVGMSLRMFLLMTRSSCSSAIVAFGVM